MHVLLALAVLGLVRVDGQTVCPAAAEVTQALTTMPGRSEVSYTARLDGAADALVITLENERGETLRTRRLAMNAPCGELAQAAAVIIAAWVGELRPSPITNVALRRRGPSPLRWDLGASFTAGLTGRDFSPGGALELALTPRRSRFGARLALYGEAPRSLALADGSVRYTRPMVQLGANVRFRPWRMLLDLHADVSLAVLVLDAAGFTTTMHATDFDLGLGAGGRAAIRVGPAAPFIGVDFVGWLRKETAAITGVTDQVTLPRYEVLFRVGCAFGVF